MKAKLLTLFTALCCVCVVYASNVITYTAGTKLSETTSASPRDDNSLYKYAFDVAISSHEFANGQGTITFAGEVTSIGDEAFLGCSGLTSLTIPNGVTSIGNYAFSFCSGLTSLTIPNSVTSIGDGAFYGCSGLTSVTIPNSVTSIGRYAFLNCSGLTSVTIPNSVTSIGDGAFMGCRGLTSVTIPNSVTSIGRSAFRYCSGLTSVTIPNRVTSIGVEAFSGCIGLTSVNIGNSVTSIGNWAFQNCTGLTAVNWNAKNCSAYQFGSQVESFVFGDSVQVIPASLCSGMNKLTSVTIPNSVTSIGDEAFYGCSGLKTIWNGSALSIVEGSSDNGYVSYYADKVYNGILIGDFVIKNDTILTGYIGSSSNVVIPGYITSIGDGAFYGCSGLTSVTIPNSVTSIGDYAFSGCSGLTSVTIPNSVTSIGDSAFRGCSGLTSVTIGSGVTSIGDYAFYGCSGLKTIWNGSALSIVEGSSDNGYVSYYADKVYNGILIGDFVIKNDTILTEYIGSSSNVVIPGYITLIGNGAFYECSGLTSVTIPNSVTSIGDGAFYECSGLTSVTIGSGVTSIGDEAFSGCSGLTSVTIPNSVTKIGEYAFYGCTKLKTVYNLSDLNIVKGETTHGFVAYYADVVYTGTPTNVSQTELQGVYAENGRVVCDNANDMRIYTLTGIDVTRENGHLQGIYIVKCGEQTQKVVVK